MKKIILWEVIAFLQIVLLHIKFYILFLYNKPTRNFINDDVFIINSVRSYIPLQVSIELTIALRAFSQGNTIIFLFDDNVLLSHDTLFKKHRPSIVKLSLYNMMFKFYRLCGVHVFFYSNFQEILQRSNYLENLDMKELKDYWLASATRFTKSLPDEKFIKENFGDDVIDLFVENAKISYTLGLHLSNLYPKQALVTSHAIYSSWGAFSLGYRKSGNHFLCYGANGYSKEILDLALNTAAANKINNVELARLEESSAADLIAYRERAQSALVSRCSNASEDQKRVGLSDANLFSTEVMSQLEKNRGKKLVAVFPNVMWDNATSFSDLNNIFDNPFTWINSLLNFARNNQSFVIVIRCHPAESKFMKSNASLYGLLSSQTLGNIPENCVIIAPDDHTSSYALINNAHCVSVYNGTIGLETIWLGKPLVLAAKAAYGFRGFTYDIRNENDYFDAIRFPEKVIILQKDRFKQFLEFSYYYFFKSGKDIGAMSKVRYLHPCLYVDVGRAKKVSIELEDLYQNYMLSALCRGKIERQKCRTLESKTS